MRLIGWKRKLKLAMPLMAVALCVYAAVSPPARLAQGVAATPARKIDFNRDIRPILSDHCIVCHGPDAANKKIRLRLDSEEAAKADLGLTGRNRRAIVPGHPEQSQLVKRITATDEAMRMPPVESGRKLTPQQIELLQEWIRQGAEWQGHWAFIAPVRPPLPNVKNTKWPRNAIDSFVLARLEKEGLQPAPEADKTTLIRRVSLDLTGLPPTPQEVDAFLRDRSPRAYERVVDRLLSSPRYGERMAARWLDVARYADTNGYQNDEDRQMWRWRDWVIEAFNRNLPFDQFTVEQLAGDLLPDATMEQRLATGFNRNHRINSEDGIIYDEYAVEYVVDRVDTTATVFLGLTVACARCHNHKYDPVTQREYYQLFAYFNNIPEYGRAIRGANSPPVMPAPTHEQQRQHDQLTRSLAAAEKQFAGYEAQLPRAQRSWEASLADQAPRQWFPGTAQVAQLSFDDGEATGRIGRAAKFDGQHSIDAGKLADFSSNDRFTLSAWVRPNAERGGVILARAETIASQVDRSPGAKLGKGYGLRLEEGKIHFNLVHDWADDAIRVETEARLMPGAWHHVLATYDGSRLAAGARIYLDGQPQKLKVAYGLLIEPIKNAEPLRIGGGADFEPFHGLIDEVRIYHRILPPDEIAALACAEPLAAIARIPERERDTAQRDKLRWAFLETAAPPEMQQAWRRLNELKEQRRKLEESFPTVMVMRERETLRDTFLLKRGAYDAPGERVARGVPAVLSPLPANAPNNRLGLAHWLVHPSNPLTSRVTVNRFWQMLFGVGLVKTTEDFGAQGERPSHPELLDWLAAEFRDGAKKPATGNRQPTTAWDVKRLLKTIVMSATYRQSSKPNPHSNSEHRSDRTPHSVDPENRLLARAPRLRLPAEMIRDQALLVAGLLVEQVGGPSVKPYQPDGVWSDLVNGGKYATDTGGALYRRSLYTYWKRTIAPPFMANFDAASRESCTVRETRTNTPLQALNLMNDVTYIEAARMLAERALREGGKTERDRVRYAFRLATARWPDERETQILLKQLRIELDDFGKDATAAARLLKVGEKPFDQKLNAVEVAAYATVASLILNLDEVITKE